MSNPPGPEPKRSKYRILGLVGQGQFGRVFCATHRQSGYLVALKNLEHQRFPTHKFLRELRFLLSLQHPNIVTFHALEHTRTGRYLVMDYCEGGTLRNLMQGDYRLNLSQSLKLIADILSGLDHAHSRGIVHCDIKPENILLNVHPTGWTARISDFGIARLTQEMVNHGEISHSGSPAYMAPERFYGQYSLSSDLYSVGILLFELLAGYRPFSGTPGELMSEHLNRPLKVPDSIPKAWQPILITALQKLSARRFRSAAAMLAALQLIVAAEELQPALGQPSIALPLLQPITLPSRHPFTAQQHTLEQPIFSLALALIGDRESAGLHSGSNHPWMYAASNHSLRVHPHPAALRTGGVASFDANQQGSLPHPIQELNLCPQGCCAVTSGGVYLVLVEKKEPSFEMAVQLVADLEPDSLIAIDPIGRWLAIARQTETEGVSLRFGKLAAPRSPVWLSPHPIHLAPQGKSHHLRRLIALDSCHVAIVSSLIAGQARSTPGRDPSHGETGLGGTVFDIVARRGDRLGSLTISLTIGQIQPTLVPYRLIATDEHNPQSLVLIDLKPLRVLRFGLEIIPKFLVAMIWGYILVDAQGQIVLLDEQGQLISHIEGPSCPTAIAPFANYGLLIATWDGTQGNLYLLDWQEMDVGLVF